MANDYKGIHTAEEDTSLRMLFETKFHFITKNVKDEENLV